MVFDDDYIPYYSHTKSHVPTGRVAAQRRVWVCALVCEVCMRDAVNSSGDI